MNLNIDWGRVLDKSYVIVIPMDYNVASTSGAGAAFLNIGVWPNNGGISHGSLVYFTSDP